MSIHLIEKWDPFSIPVEESKDEYGEAKFFEMASCPPKLSKYYEELRKQEELWDKEDDENLAKLISHRRDLLT